MCAPRAHCMACGLFLGGKQGARYLAKPASLASSWRTALKAFSASISSLTYSCSLLLFLTSTTRPTRSRITRCPVREPMLTPKSLASCRTLRPGFSRRRDTIFLRNGCSRASRSDSTLSGITASLTRLNPLKKSLQINSLFDLMHVVVGTSNSITYNL